MSHSTLAAPAKAPVNAPVKSPVVASAPSPVSALAPASFVPPASSRPVGTSVVPKVASSYNISWIGIVGILAAFLVLTIIALVCFWYKKRAFKKAFREQRESYVANGSSSTGKGDWSDDEEAARSKRGRMILADFEQALETEATPKRFNGAHNAGNENATAPTDTILEHDIPVYTRDKHVVEGFKEKHLSVAIRNKTMFGGFTWNSLGENVEDEVFYKGEEGSQMGVRYSSRDFDNLEIFSRVPLSPREKPKKRSKGELARLLGSLSRSHTTAAAPDREEPSSKKGWTLRTLSLPAYHQKVSQESQAAQKPRDDTGLGSIVDIRVESLSKGIGSLSPHPNLLPTSPKHSYSPKFAYGNFTLTPWIQKPSRLAVQSNAVGSLLHLQLHLQYRLHPLHHFHLSHLRGSHRLHPLHPVHCLAVLHGRS